MNYNNLSDLVYNIQRYQNTYKENPALIYYNNLYIKPTKTGLNDTKNRIVQDARDYYNYFKNKLQQPQWYNQPISFPSDDLLHTGDYYYSSSVGSSL